MPKAWSRMSTEEKVEAIKDHSNDNLEKITALEKEVKMLRRENADMISKVNELILAWNAKQQKGA